MNIKMLIIEMINFNRFKKIYKKNHESMDYNSNLQICDSYIRLLASKKKLELVKLYKCYTFLCMENDKGFYELSSEIELPENYLMILYYKLILNIDETNEVFSPLYDDFINQKFKVNGSGVFWALKKEVDVLRDFLVNHTKISHKGILQHIQKSKLPQVQRVYKKLEQAHSNSSNSSISDR